MTTVLNAQAAYDAIDEGLWQDDDDAVRLLGSRCPQCATVVFPRQQSCPRCTRTEMVDHPLATRGRLWSWTVQRFRPKSPYVGPDEFEDFGVGYVDLDGEVLVEARLVGDPLPPIGSWMELVLIPVDERVPGTPRATFAFTAAREAS